MNGENIPVERPSAPVSLGLVVELPSLLQERAHGQDRNVSSDAFGRPQPEPVEENTEASWSKRRGVPETVVNVPGRPLRSPITRRHGATARAAAAPMPHAGKKMREKDGVTRK